MTTYSLGQIAAIFTTSVAFRRELGFDTKLPRNVMHAYAEAIAEENLTKMQLLNRITEIIEKFEIKAN